VDLFELLLKLCMQLHRNCILQQVDLARSASDCSSTTFHQSHLKRTSSEITQ
jgi:hypothetical protein